MAVERLFATFAAHHDPSDLLDALATGVVLLDAADGVIHANVAAQGLLGVGLTRGGSTTRSSLTPELSMLPEICADSRRVSSCS